VSPKKTYEGYAGGFLSAITFAVLYVYLWNRYNGSAPVGILEASLIGAFLSILTVIGDLIESAIKRDAKTKDSASLIPGHGGVLDLADALFITLPSGYYILYFKQMAGLSL
jgi:phosphatidate cytidylyltransferase